MSNCVVMLHDPNRPFVPFDQAAHGVGTQDVSAADHASLIRQLAEALRENAQLRQENIELTLSGQIEDHTGLYNKAYFMKQAHALFQSASHKFARREDEHSQKTFSVVIVDVNGLKKMNDELGHLAGDELISFVAAKIENCFRGTDIVARIGGDEFGILLPTACAQLVADKLEFLRQNNLSFTLNDGTNVSANFAFGIAGFNGQSSFDEMYKQADEAMYEDKKAGRKTVFSKPATAIAAAGPQPTTI